MLSVSRLNARKMPILLSAGYQVSPGTVLVHKWIFSTNSGLFLFILSLRQTKHVRPSVVITDLKPTMWGK
jgi:hypothetical protein